MARRFDPPQPGGAHGAAPFPLLDQRRWLLLAGAVLFIVSLLVFAQGNPLPVLYTLLTDAVVAAVWIIASFGIGSAVPLPRAGANDPDAPGACVFRIATRTGMGLGAISLLTLFAGWAGVLNRITAWGILMLGTAIVIARLVRAARPTTSDEINERMNAWLRAPAGIHWLWLIAIPIAAFAFVAANVPPGVLWHNDDPLGYDVVEYHFQVPREWYEAGRIIPLTHNAFSFFPFNVEMHYLLAMHLRGGPWAGMYLAQIMHACFTGLTVVAVYGLAARLTKNRASSVIAALATSAVPWTLFLAPIGYNEGGLLLFGTLAVGWAIIGLIDGRSRLASFAFGGALAGFACGAKLTAVPMILLATAAVCTLIGFIVPVRDGSGNDRLRRAILGPALFVLIGVATFSPWLVRNLIWTGNPVFPERARLLGQGYFSDVQVERWERAHRPREEPSPGVKQWTKVHFPQALDQKPPSRVLEGWRQVFWDWRYGFLLFPMAIGGLICGHLHRTKRDAETVFVPAALLVLLALFWLGFTHLQSRFFIFGIPLTALLIAQIQARAWPLIGALCVMFMAISGSIRASTELEKLIPALGIEDPKLIAEITLSSGTADRIAQAKTVTLVGDAKAFWYPIEMSRLRYRTVFDVDSQTYHDMISAWRGTATPPAPGELIIVDVGELKRFYMTYRGLPQPPDAWGEGTGTFMIEGGAANLGH